MPVNFMENVLPKDGMVSLMSPFDRVRLDQWFKQLQTQIPWDQKKIRIFGKQVMQPRLIAWYGDSHCRYTYSGLTLEPLPWDTSLREIKANIEGVSHKRFNSVLLNLYRDGHDSMGAHQDNEPELGEDPVVASLSLGASRKFVFQHIREKDLKIEMMLKHGDLLVMEGKTQSFWKHALPKSKKVNEPRINLTFRSINRPCQF